MSRWKIFGRSKSKEDEITEPEEIIKEEEKTEENIETTQEPEEQPLAGYNETLYTGGSTSKKGTTASSDQRIWRDIDAIEEKVDNLHITRAQKPVTELDKTVDKLILKSKKK
jgi:hypothetical protein